jgi:drug/metabolite transporter (DMT)-like permease
LPTIPQSKLPPAPRGKVIAAFAAVYIIWGSTYLAIKIAVVALPPFLMAGSRFIIAGTMLYAWARLQGHARPTLREWRTTAIIGTFLLLGGNGAVVSVAHLLPSGMSALLVATTPFWMVAFEGLRKGGSRPSASVVAGLILGFVGLGVLLGPGTLPSGGGVHLGGAFVLFLGTLSWSAGSVYSSHARLPASTCLALGMEQLAGGAILLVAGLATGEAGSFDPAGITTRSVIAFVYLIVFGSLLGFSSYIWLLSVSTPARVSTYAYVNPVVAVFLGWMLGGESLTTRTLVASGIIVLAVAILTTDQGRRVRARAEAKRRAAAEPSLRSGPQLVPAAAPPPTAAPVGAAENAREG